MARPLLPDGVTWLTENSGVISAFANIGLLAVWIIYAQVFYKDYRRRRRPRILIDQLAGPDPDSECVVTNLSSETVYVERIIAIATTPEGVFVGPVTERGTVSSSDQSEIEIVSKMRQGPVATGQLIVIGTLKDLAHQAAIWADDRDRATQSCKQLEVRVVATMSSEDSPVGAWKRFRLTGEGDRRHVSAEEIGTAQMYKRKQKRRVLGWLDEIKAPPAS